MDLATAQAIADAAIYRDSGRHLSDVEIAILQGAWEGQTYEQIAAAVGYSPSYLTRTVGPQLWKVLSDALGEPVSKTNFRGALPRRGSDGVGGDGVGGDGVMGSQASESIAPPSHSPTHPPSHPPLRIDWGEIPDVQQFSGRTAELATLHTWLATDRCRLVALLGMGGVGKSTLAAKLTTHLAQIPPTSPSPLPSPTPSPTHPSTASPPYTHIIWRSLRNAPPLDDLLGDLVLFLSDQSDTQADLRRLLHWLRTHRCLVVLDNVETLMAVGDRAGQYQAGYEGYGDLFRTLAESPHQSRIMLTSREKPAEVAALEGEAVRSLQLTGAQDVGLAILDAKGLMGSETEKQELCDRYGGNPLALKIVASSIKDLFGGAIADFFQQDTMLFNGIRRLLDQQFERLTVLEQTVMGWLAINREWTTIDELAADIVPAVARSQLLETLESLTWRSLIEKRPGAYTQQPVVMEYVTEGLVEVVAEELIGLQPLQLDRLALIKTTVKDYIRDSQTRLILQPIAQRLLAVLKLSESPEQRIAQLLETLRKTEIQYSGYGVGNLLNLAIYLGLDAAQIDWSGLTIWHANLQGVRLAGVNFAGTRFAKTLFTQTLGSVLAIAYSPGGDLLATGDANGWVQLWQTTNGQSCGSFQGHHTWVWSVAWQPDGRRLASGSTDQTVRIWDVKTGQSLHTLTGHSNWVAAVAYSPDGSLLASGSKDNTIRLWDGQTGQCRAVFDAQHPNAWLWSVTWLAGGALVAGAYADGAIRLWNVATGDCDRTIAAHDYWVLSVALHPDGTVLASSGFDQTVKLWNWQTGECLKAIATPDSIWRMRWSPDGTLLAGGSHDYTVRLWDRDTLQCLRVLPGHKFWVWDVAWSPDGDHLTTASHDQTVKLWDRRSGVCLQTLQGYSDSIWSLAWSPDGTRLLCSSTNCTVKVWHPQTQTCQVLHGHSKEVWAVVWSPDGRWMASGSADGTIRIWDAATGKCARVLSGHDGVVWSLAWSPRGDCLASGGHDRTVRLWEVASGQCLQILVGHTHFVPSVAWSNDGQRLASGSLDGTIRLWQAASGQCLTTLKAGHPVYPVAFCPATQGSPAASDDLLASGDYEGQVKLWNGTTGQCLQSFAGHHSVVFSLAWSPDGTRLATAGADLTARLWQVETGDCQRVFEGQNWSSAVAFSPDGAHLAIAYLEQPIQLWQADAGAMVQTLKSDRPYEGMNITNVRGLTNAQKATLQALGAIEERSL